VRNLLIPIFISLLPVSFYSSQHTIHAKEPAPVAAIRVDDVFNSLQLQQYGLSASVFDYAYKGYQNLLEKKLITRTEYLTICDLSQSSKKKRFYLIDLDNNKVLINTYVAHGRNSGAEYASRFSNRAGSLQTSIGFYVTGTTYIGEHGLSLKIYGLEKTFNNNAAARNIVVHGAEYAEENWLSHSSYLGRSYGCPAIPKKQSNTIIDIIKNGTCLFIYHPDKKYLKRSKILNG
jgi:hypothetical protein